MKNNSGIRIHRVLFFSLAGLLFLLWLNSFTGLIGNFSQATFKLKPDCQNVLASERDFHEAKDETLFYDSLIVVDTTAEPGDTFYVTVRLSNKTIPVVGITMILNYDTSLIVPLDTVADPCAGDSSPCPRYDILSYKTERSDILPWMLWNARAENLHLDTLRFYANTDTWESPIPCLPTGGSGPVVRFKFRVKPNAVEGDKDTIQFVLWDEATGNYANTLVDTFALENYLPRTKDGIFTVAGHGTINHCPVFTTSAPADSYSVSEGQTLQFTVTSTDQDVDNITLSLDPLSPSGLNYNFTTKAGAGSVTQAFDYTPDYDEAPAVRYATFRAVDEHDCVTTKTVAIRVLNTIQDMIVAGDEEGGVPASTGILVPFMLTSTLNIYGFQFTFRWDAARLDVDSIVRTGAIEGFSMYTNLGDSAGKATVLVFGLAGETIPAGLDTVLYAAFSVHADAPSVEVPITLENAREAVNPGDPSKTLGTDNGKFTIDKFGDVNLDRLVDVADVVSLVAYILGEIGFTPRQFAASDINTDTYVNVGDLVAMIDIILGRWMGPSPSSYPGIMAKVSLDYKDLQPGSSGEVKVFADLKVPVAGAQLEIGYDPASVTLSAPRLSDRSGQFLVESHDDGKGKLSVVLYNFSNDPIPAGVGNILTIPAVVKPDAPKALKFDLKKVVLSDQKAVLLPTEEETPSLPSVFELNQNYPNPFNPSTTIRFVLPASTDGGAALPTTLKIYNILGEAVKTLVDEPMSPGAYQKVWDGNDDQGNPVASGIYFYKLHSGNFTDTKKMVMMK